MKTLAELDKAMKDLNEMKSELSDRIGGSEWVICFYDHFTTMQFGVWKLKHNWDINGKVATLSTYAIIDRGAYTQEELQLVLERIMELANE